MRKHFGKPADVRVAVLGLKPNTYEVMEAPSVNLTPTPIEDDACISASDRMPPKMPSHVGRPMGEIDGRVDGSREPMIMRRP